nr:hypothetical protein [Tanacetum cinerariifolium]
LCKGVQSSQKPRERHNSRNEEVNIASVSNASTNVSPTSANIDAASISQNIARAYIASQSNGSQIKFKDINQIDEDDMEEMDDHALVTDEEAPTEFALIAKTSAECKDLSWTRISEFVDDTITDYSRPSPAIESTSDDVQNRNSSETEASSSTISSKPFIKFVKATVRPTENKTVKVESIKKPIVNGCSRHMTGNISYLFDYETFDGGYVSFGQGGCKITGKGTIKTGKLEFENVYFVKDLKYNLFSVSQIYDNKNSVLLTDLECIVLRRNFKLSDDTNVLLRTPRQHNMYSINLNNIIPHKDLTCLVAKASADKCMLWHRRLGHLNFKTMNKLVRHNLVRRLPTKCFENDHTCTACLKGMQHKASCKSKLVNSVTKPLHTFHMDLFGPTSDETSGILRKFITEIENLKDLKVKIIRCDNEGEFRNKKMNDFCSRKGIKREFSNARTPQQNGVTERRNRTLIEVARTMLADAKLPVTFWAEAVNTACYVQNKVLENKSQNKTLYELFIGRTPAIGFLKPFGCHVMILNTLDNLGKFEAKGDEGYFIGYSMSSKAFGVFNKRTKKVKENLHVDFLEKKAIKKGINSTNLLGTKSAASQEVKKDVSSLRYIALPNWVYDALLESSSTKPQDDCSTDVPKSSGNLNPNATSTNPLADQMETLTVETPIPTVSSPVPTTCFTDSQEPSNPSWVEAMQEELLQFKIQNVWCLVDCPKGVRPIETKWVLKNKKDKRGIVIRNKARLVAQGHTQEEGFDYDEVFSPVVRIKAIRLFLAYASFMIYSLSDGCEECLSLCHAENLKPLCMKNSKMSAMGELNFFLGLQVLQKKDDIFLSQDKYVGDILKKFRYSDVRSVNTPMDKENP